jgi:hypothetical protein
LADNNIKKESTRGNHPFSGVGVTVVRTLPLRVMSWGPRTGAAGPARERKRARARARTLLGTIHSGGSSDAIKLSPNYNTIRYTLSTSQPTFNHPLIVNRLLSLSLSLSLSLCLSVSRSLFRARARALSHARSLSPAPPPGLVFVVFAMSVDVCHIATSVCVSYSVILCLQCLQCLYLCHIEICR